MEVAGERCIESCGAVMGAVTVASCLEASGLFEIEDDVAGVHRGGTGTAVVMKLSDAGDVADRIAGWACRSWRKKRC
jgi:hypothetical protein